MNQVYEPHKSSVFDTDANLVSLSLYLIPLLGNFMSLGIIAWVFPVVLLFVEKKSPLVYFHAVQSLVLQAVVLVFNIVVILFGFVSAGTSIITGINLFGAVGAVGLVSLLSIAVNVVVIALEIVGMIKSYGWEAYHLPVFGEITRKITKS